MEENKTVVTNENFDWNAFENDLGVYSQPKEEIAAAYDKTLSNVAVGEVVAVTEERVAGLPERYADLYRPTLLPKGLRTAVSNSVVQCGAEAAGAQIENMEGAAFFAVAAALGIPAAEVRAVSNRVGESFAAWRVEEACEALARELERIVDEIRSAPSQA